MTRKRILIGLLFLTLMLGACGKKEETNESNSDTGKLDVYTTVYPLQYFTERIGGDTVSVKSIYPAGTDEHTFDPTQKEMMKLADADLFFYVGLGLEGFVENAEKTLKNQHVLLLPTGDTIDPSKLMEGHHHDSDEEEHDHESEEHDESTTDPHVWISPVLSMELATAVRDGLIEKAPENKQLYEENFKALKSDLEALDAEFTTMADQASSKTFFVSHAAFGYLADQYGLEQISIAGLNTQNEPSQKELAHIVEEAKQKNVKTILFEQNVSSKLTKVVQNEIGADSAILHNLSVLTKEDVANKEDYFSLMKRNIDVLSEALN
ncbi:metal ABC transporter solute-binding protein, Zn/Mn family [Sporosarcina gallistercoris]|uniref:Zinc ABC transporter substrate-binding protein n=1 Tax=Sporosarcina gallistercoris TaxID=2762245 RepID=A0ABR8PHW1_9BACL|nr:zinc ABC transporter substrate-binding protein [Sporosarcina gallistercoris]MBD7907757.1 zinc ABC transporter substrate-binding protein [Sporosarcina gallistercoris]